MWLRGPGPQQGALPCPIRARPDGIRRATAINSGQSSPESRVSDARRDPPGGDKSVPKLIAKPRNPVTGRVQGCLAQQPRAVSKLVSSAPFGDVQLGSQACGAVWMVLGAHRRTVNRGLGKRVGLSAHDFGSRILDQPPTGPAVIAAGRSLISGLGVGMRAGWLACSGSRLDPLRLDGRRSAHTCEQERRRAVPKYEGEATRGHGQLAG